jgi:capsular exopolysaccharide synthesis family protein
LELREYLRIARRSAVLLIALVLLGVIAAGAYALLQKPTYSATAEDYVSTESAASTSDLSTGASFAQQVAAGYAHVAGTTYVLQPVISDLGLPESPTQLAKRVDIVSAPDTSVLQITVEDQSPSRAAAIANAISERLTVAVDALTPESQTGTTLVKVTQIEPAPVPTSPSSPNLPLYLAIGALLGLVLGVVVAVAREVLDTRVREASDVRVADLPVLGEVLFDRRADRSPLAVQNRPRGVEAEAYQVARTNLQFLDLRSGSNAIVITSSIPGEGKTVTAANLSVTLASTERVLLIDADLRRPRAAKVFGIDGSVGLSDVLIGQVGLDEALQEWGTAGLTVLPAGRIPPNPADLLRSKAMRTLLDQVEGRFDVVIIDTPPLLAVSDAAVLAREVSGVIVVAAMGTVRRPQLAKTLEMLSNIDVHVLGMLPTMVKRKRSETYSYSTDEDDSGIVAASPRTVGPNVAEAVDVARMN